MSIVAARVAQSARLGVGSGKKDVYCLDEQSQVLYNHNMYYRQASPRTNVKASSWSKDKGRGAALRLSHLIFFHDRPRHDLLTTATNFISRCFTLGVMDPGRVRRV